MNARRTEAAYALQFVRDRAEGWALRRSESRRWRSAGDRSAPRIYYGQQILPDRGGVLGGGLVKCQDLQDAFPADVRTPNVLYLVSSALPRGAWAIADAARAAGARVVLNQNGVAYPAWHGSGWRWSNRPLRDVLQRADVVLYQSEFCRRSADRYLGPCRGASRILHNAADTRRFTPVPSPVEGGPVLVLAGSHMQWYRVDLALQTLVETQRRLPGARLIVAGRLRWRGDREDLARSQLDERIAGLPLHPSCVSVTGPYTQNEAPDVLRAGHILLHTKVNDPCPRLVAEALACGLPVVYSATGGVPELVGPDAGEGVPARETWDRLDMPSAPELAARVATVWSDHRRYAINARVRAERHLSLDRWINLHTEIFRNIIEQ